MSARWFAIPVFCFAYLTSPWAWAGGAGLAIIANDAANHPVSRLSGFNATAAETVPSGRPPLPGTPASPAPGAPPPSAPPPAVEAPPPPAQTVAPDRALIRQLQRALPAHGYHTGPETGRLDEATARAILAYQHDARLPPDNQSTPALKATLQSLYYHRPAIMAGHR